MGIIKTLQENIDEYKVEFASLVPQSVRDIIRDAAKRLAASGIERNAVDVGDTAPDFTLADWQGNATRLADLFAHGPVVLSFYRGGWCPYCNLEFAAQQHFLPEIQKRGATLIAVSPQTPEATRETQGATKVEFPLLVDAGNHVARQYGLAYELDPALIPLFKDFGIDIPAANGQKKWELPLAATYVIQPDSIIHTAFVSTDYTTRMDPRDILIALDDMLEEGSGTGLQSR